MSLNNLSTIPPYHTMASTEPHPLRIDVSNWLAASESPSAVSCTLTNLSTGASSPAGLSGSPSVSGNVIAQTVTGLVDGTSYELKVTFTAAAGKVLAGKLIIQCVD